MEIEYKMIEAFGSFGIIVFLLIYVVKYTIPNLISKFTEALDAQRKEFTTALEKHDETLTMEMRKLNKAIDRQLKAIIYTLGHIKPSTKGAIPSIVKDLLRDEDFHEKDTDT